MDQRHRPKSMKILYKNIQEKLHDIGLGNDSLNMKLKTETERQKQINWNYQKLKLLRFKGYNQQSEKENFGEKKVCKSYI